MNRIERNCKEIRANQDSRTIDGYAVVFDSWSRDLGGFTEIIRRTAITEELLNESDIIMNQNHDDNQMLARWNQGEGTLRLSLDERGLRFEFEAPETERGNELLWNIRTGNLFECSFAFSLPDNSTCQRWFRDENGALKREITQIGGVYDCSIVTVAAYPATSVANREEIDIEAITRSLDEAAQIERDRLLEAQRLEEEARKDEIKAKLDEKLKEFYDKVNF